MKHWLMKSEPSVFGIDDLRDRPGQTEPWDGVRNYQVRNMMRDDMQPGDTAFFYHSNCAEPGIVGIMEIASRAYPDPTQFDPENSHFDPKSDPNNPRWLLVDVKFKRKLSRTIGLSELKAKEELAGMPLVRRGNRLSVMPVTEDEWNYIIKLE